MTETYFSIDIETDGPCAGIHSMLSFGIAVFEQGVQTGTFSRNLELLPGGIQHPETMEWWSGQKEAWEVCRYDPRPLEKAMKECADWMETFPGKLTGCGWPVSFDWGFLNYYLWRFAGRNPLGFAAMDLRSYVAGLNRHPGYFGIPEGDINKMAKRRPYLKPHVAVDDAEQQGDLLMAALEFARKCQTRGSHGQLVND